MAGRLRRRLAGLGRRLSRASSSSRASPPREGDPEWGISRGRLLPAHQLLDGRRPDRPPARRPTFPEALAQSLVLVHGGMAQNVGPILNMVTAKYLLREPRRSGRRGSEALEIFDEIVAAVERPTSAALGSADDPELGRAAQADHPLGDATRSPSRSSARPATALGDDFWGFLMLGGMSGGGMAFFVAPHRQDEFQDQIAAIMQRVKVVARRCAARSPWSRSSTTSGSTRTARSPTLETGAEAMMPPRYYTLQVPRMIAAGTAALDPHRAGRTSTTSPTTAATPASCSASSGR